MRSRTPDRRHQRLAPSAFRSGPWVDDPMVALQAGVNMDRLASVSLFMSPAARVQ